MKRANVLTIILTVLAVMLAGCAQDGQEAGGDNQTNGGQTGDNQTDGNQTGGNQTGGGDGEANVSSVTVLSFNETAMAGENVTVCWRVEGTGNIPHTALHYDNQSHNGSEVTFGDYAGGATYPDNETQQAESGYDLPGEFCSSIPAPDQGSLYFRAHAMIEAPGMLSEEKEIQVQGSGG